MATLTPYRGLQVVTPNPTGDGGLAIQDDLKSLVDWSPKSVWAQSSDPTAGDDQTANFFPGSLWLRTNTTRRGDETDRGGRGPVSQLR